MSKRIPRYVSIREEYVRGSYSTHFTRGKLYKVDSEGIITVDSGVSIAWEDYGEEALNKILVGGKAL